MKSSCTRGFWASKFRPPTTRLRLSPLRAATGRKNGLIEELAVCSPIQVGWSFTRNLSTWLGCSWQTVERKRSRLNPVTGSVGRFSTKWVAPSVNAGRLRVTHPSAFGLFDLVLHPDDAHFLVEALLPECGGRGLGRNKGTHRRAGLASTTRRRRRSGRH